MKKKYHLEVIRILAILMVMYNHSAAFMSFSNQSGVEYAISFLFSMVCKGAVPLFFMVSGALLLGKNESGKDLFQKRILRMILVIVIFSFLYYMKLVLKGERPFAPFSFLLSLPTDLVYLPYWFLYSYLGVLTILPILPSPQHLESIHPRHHNIQKYCIDLPSTVFYQIETFLSARCLCHIIDIF